MKHLKQTDPKILSLIKEEARRQKETLAMIPSENYTSEAVMETLGSILTNKYSEGFPKKRYYQGNSVIDSIEILAAERAKKLFDVPYVNVQALSGSPANSAVYLAILNNGDKMMGLDLSSGGHITHGNPLGLTGRLFKVLHYKLSDKNVLDYDAIKHIAESANGDARIALNLLELAVLTIGSNITLEAAQKLLSERSKRYDKKGEDHYDTVSAFIKTMRGSDIDAALIWLYKMILSGEEPRFLFRRMAIFASEDVGNADPHALPFVISAWQAFEMVGMPEGEFFLAHACVYVTQAPKSNAVTNAMYGAKAHVQNAPSLEVPYRIRNAPVKAMKEHGYHEGYQYAHNAKDAIVKENYFPIGHDAQTFYEPSNRGFEADIKERWERVKKMVRG
jgi:hypothetical protein